MSLVPDRISELTQIKLLMEMLVTQGFPASRPQVSVLVVEEDTGTIPVNGQLLNCQLLGIAGFKADGTIVEGSSLWAEIDSITGATDDERVYIKAAISSGFALVSSASLIIFILTSPNIVINLVGGTIIDKMHFYYLAPTYLINP